MAWLSRFQPQLLALLRITAAYMYFWHGTAKFFGYPTAMGHVELLSLMGAAGVLEIGGGLLLMLGLFTRPVAFLLSGQMAVAYFMAASPACGCRCSTRANRRRCFASSSCTWPPQAAARPRSMACCAANGLELLLRACSQSSVSAKSAALGCSAALQILDGSRGRLRLAIHSDLWLLTANSGQVLKRPGPYQPSAAGLEGPRPAAGWRRSSCARPRAGRRPGGFGRRRCAACALLRGC